MLFTGGGVYIVFIIVQSIMCYENKILLIKSYLGGGGRVYIVFIWFEIIVQSIMCYEHKHPTI